MSNLNAGIILGGRQPDVINSFAQGQRARAVSDEMQSRNALRNVYQTQGAGILAGDQNALNALAQHDPQQALAIQGQHQVQSQRNQTMQMRIAEYARSVGKEQAAAQAAQLEQGITRAIGAYQAGDLNAVNQILQSAGEQPLESLDQFPAIAALYGDALETLKSVTEFGADPDPEYTTINGQLVQSNAAGGPVAVQVDGLKEEAPEPLSPEGKRQADINAGFLSSAPSGADFETTQKFRKEFSGLPAVKAFSEQSQAFGRIVASAKDPSPAGDLAMIFNFMKVLDPGSVVRESEFATAAQASAWLQQSEEAGMAIPRPIAGAIRQLATGQRLSPEQRQDFLNRGESLYNEAERGFEFIRSQYEGIAQRSNISVEDGLIDFRFQDEQPTEAVGSGSQTGFQFQNDQQRLLFEKYAVPSGG